LLAAVSSRLWLPEIQPFVVLISESAK